MRTWLVATALTVSACATPPAADPSPADALVAEFDAKYARGEDIVSEIGAMHARDRLLREIIMQGLRTEMSGETRLAYINRTEHHFDRVSAENTRRLRAILRILSWQELTALSPNAAEQAFSLISHSNDIAFKREMASHFEQLARAGQMRGDRVAILVDDIALAEGRAQIYGTNLECHHGIYQPKPIEAVETLDARRAALGLNPIAEYVAESRQVYGECPADYSGN